MEFITKKVNCIGARGRVEEGEGDGEAYQMRRRPIGSQKLLPAYVLLPSCAQLSEGVRREDAQCLLGVATVFARGAEK